MLFNVASQRGPFKKDHQSIILLTRYVSTELPPETFNNHDRFWNDNKYKVQLSKQLVHSKSRSDYYLRKGREGMIYGLAIRG